MSAGEPLTAEQAARLFHETYEQLAPTFGYETREESRVPWDQVPENNRALMVAVVTEVRTALLAALRARLEQAERGALGPTPSHEGGPGHEEAYWFRAKLNASIRHLRDVEDWYRLKGGLREGGLRESFNMARADRARDIYEQITEDFFNGKMGQPTFRERLLAAEARAEQAERERDDLGNALARERAKPEGTFDQWHRLQVVEAALAQARQEIKRHEQAAYDEAKRYDEALVQAKIPAWIGDEPVIEDYTFGQGSFGRRCRLCCGDDYDGALEHAPGCPGADPRAWPKL